jgi:hypothetical protein
MITVTTQPEAHATKAQDKQGVLLSPIATLKEHGGQAVSCGCEDFECGCGSDCGCNNDDVRPG